MELKYVFADFKNYCPKCKYSSYPEKADPCNECLEVGANEGTKKPVKFKEKTIKESKGGGTKART